MKLGMRNVKIKTRDLILVSVAAGISVALSFLKLFAMPQGGSVTLEAIPLFYVAFRFGTLRGVAAGVISGVVQLLLRPLIVHPVQIALDYPIAMGICGLAGLFRTSRSDHGMRAAVSASFGAIAVLVVGLQWAELKRVSRLDEIEIQRSADARIVVRAAADTVLGGLQATVVTFRGAVTGKNVVVAANSVYGETAREWMRYATEVVRSRQAEWLGSFLAVAAALAGVALVASRVRVSGLSLGVILASIAKWAAHVVSGAVFFSAYAPAGESVWIYSAAYNAAYAIPQLLLALLILPAVLRRTEHQLLHLTT